MAISKTITYTYQYQNNATSPTAVTIVGDPIVQDGQLVADPRVINPGVFSAGTPREGTASNPDNDTDA